jgi:hypothetical protein
MTGRVTEKAAVSSRGAARIGLEEKEMQRVTHKGQVNSPHSQALSPRQARIYKPVPTGAGGGR